MEMNYENRNSSILSDSNSFNKQASVDLKEEFIINTNRKLKIKQVKSIKLRIILIFINSKRNIVGLLKFYIFYFHVVKK